MWTREQSVALLSSKKFQMASTIFVSATSGFVAGHFSAARRLETKYALIADQEIEEAKKFYKILHKKDEFSTPEGALGIDEDLASKAADALREYSGEEPLKKAVLDYVDDGSPEAEKLIEEGDAQAKKIGVPPVRASLNIPKAPHVIKNIFEVNPENDEWDQAAEEEKRTILEPYILAHNEFLEGVPDYPQHTLTYFAGDDVLVDERDQPIQDVDVMVGDDNLTKFGHGSGDKNIVYVRNDRMEMDFEIALSQGEYTKEVLGFIEHSDKRGKVRKFRSDDE